MNIQVGLLAIAAAIICFGPKRTLLTGVVLAANVDMPTTIGNAIKHLLVATMFAYQSGYRPRWPARPLKTLGWLSISFAAVAVFGTLRGDLDAGLKLLGGMYAIWIVAQGVSCLYVRHLMGATEIRRSIVVMLTIGVVGQAASQEARFTSYVNAQQFAVLLVVLSMMLLVAHLQTRSPADLVVLLLAVLAILANGSRTAFLGFLFGALVITAWTLRKSHHKAAMLIAASLCFFGVTTLAAGSAVSTESLRVFDFVDVLRGDGTSVGTFNFRLEVYAQASTELGQREDLELLIGSGSGTARDAVLKSGVYIATGVEIDPNRAMHNEWLRIVYEFGLLGIVVFLCLIFRVILTAFRLLRGTEDQQYAVLPFAAAGPVLLLFLSIENILATGLSGAGAAFSLAVGSFLFARQVGPRLRPLDTVMRRSSLVNPASS